MSPSIARHHAWGRLDRPRAQLVAALALGWAPIAVLGLLGRLVTGRIDPLVADISVHVRLLVAVPLFLVADLALAHQSRVTLRRLADEGFVGDDERARFERAVRSAERLRATPIAEALLLAGAVTVGVATLVGWVGATGMVQGAPDVGFGAARVWFGLVGLPLFGFLLGRSLWRWIIWAITLVAVARLRLRLALAHPDRRGGIGFMALPSLAFGAPFLFALSSVLTASWGAQVAAQGGSLGPFRMSFLVFLVGGELLALAPLLALTPRLFVAARRAIVEYGSLATDYVRRFHHRWIAGGARSDLLGTADLQALNDLGGAYREAVERAVPIAFGARELIVLLVVMALPALPLIFAFVPTEVLHRLVQSLVGAR